MLKTVNDHIIFLSTKVLNVIVILKIVIFFPKEEFLKRKDTKEKLNMQSLEVSILVPK